MNAIFKALSDPTRRKILEMLTERDLKAGDIADNFSITKASISHHLSILKEAELIQSERQGQAIVYSLNTTVFQETLRWFYDFMNKGSDSNDEK
ncbi:MAG: ArsR family transcriptional regulator [delta proteobacterium ML8_F1]|nr:MAG: ArsR family transcriptional regulator [delta proteobacterium ML8_F1]